MAAKKSTKPEKKISFNQFLALEHTDPTVLTVQAVWQTRPGRLSRSSVEDKCQRLGVPAGVGTTVYDNYLNTIAFNG